MRTIHHVLIVTAALAVVSGATIGAATEKPTVTCKDGTTGPGGRGACRGHGGVAKGATGGAASSATAPTAPAAATAPTAPTHASTTAASQHASGGKAATTDSAGALAKCKDGMYWHGAKHSGSCSHHGGVAEWLDGSKSK
jgi:hypothetical protein